jgi:hypothetical protein
MTSNDEIPQKWKEIGRSTTTPTEKKDYLQIEIDSYYVVIGFEVNNSKAYIDNVYYPLEDYGHAFIYLVKNGIIVDLLSFGPRALGTVNKIKDGRKNARPATANYLIREKIKAFKIPISLSNAEKLKNEIKRIRAEISTGKAKYTVYMNDTCAETARDALESADIKTPSGSGLIKVGIFSIAYAVNPYKWYDNLKKEVGGERDYIFPATSLPWLPEPDLEDPVFSEIPEDSAESEVSEDPADSGIPEEPADATDSQIPEDPIVSGSP